MNKPRACYGNEGPGNSTWTAHWPEALQQHQRVHQKPVPAGTSYGLTGRISFLLSFSCSPGAPASLLRSRSFAGPHRSLRGSYPAPHHGFRSMGLNASSARAFILRSPATDSCIVFATQRFIASRRLCSRGKSCHLSGGAEAETLTGHHHRSKHFECGESIGT